MLGIGTTGPSDSFSLADDGDEIFPTVTAGAKEAAMKVGMWQLRRVIGLFVCA
jgi:hypothetical protein